MKVFGDIADQINSFDAAIHEFMFKLLRNRASYLKIYKPKYEFMIKLQVLKDRKNDLRAFDDR